VQRDLHVPSVVTPFRHVIVPHVQVGDVEQLVFGIFGGEDVIVALGIPTSQIPRGCVLMLQHGKRDSRLVVEPGFRFFITAPSSRRVSTKVQLPHIFCTVLEIKHLKVPSLVDSP